MDHLDERSARSSTRVQGCSGWNRSYRWSVPTNANLAGPDHDTDRERHRDKKWHSTRWASDPSWSQSKHAKPTHADPEDDRLIDPALPSGSTPETWDPTQDQGFWAEDDPSHQGSAASASQGTPSMHWRAEASRRRRDVSSKSGDTSEGRTSGPRLGSIDEIWCLVALA